MKRLTILVILTIILIGAGLFFWQSNKKVTDNETAIPTQEQIKTFETKEDIQGEIAVKVIPIKLSPKENVRFKIALNTHSADLNYSLKDVSKMEDDKGNEYKPVSWSGGKGGHHLEGELTFPPFFEEAKSVKLTIRQIGGVDRIFVWDL